MCSLSPFSEAAVPLKVNSRFNIIIPDLPSVVLCILYSHFIFLAILFRTKVQRIVYFSTVKPFWVWLTTTQSTNHRGENTKRLKLEKADTTILYTGVILRDSHGVAQVRFVTGNKILRILKSKGLAPDLPEDLYHLIKKAVAIRKHLERNRKVTASRFLSPVNFQGGKRLNLFGEGVPLAGHLVNIR